jgi:hypothetical protein
LVRFDAIEFQKELTWRDPISGVVTVWRYDAWRRTWYQVQPLPLLSPLVSLTQQAGYAESLTRWQSPQW